MISLNDNIYPLIRVIQPELNVYRLRELVEDYITENSLPTFHAGELLPAMQVSGMAHEHAARLAAYLNRNNAVATPFSVKQGYFIDFNLDEHYWLQSDNLIIDLAIQKFRNYPQLEEKILADLLDYSYLICDNPLDPIHQLYFEDVTV